MELRLERPEDYNEVEVLVREAFWNVYVPGCNEHYLMHIMRNQDVFIPKLDFVAVSDGRIAGNIAYTRAVVISDGGTEHEVICFGPLSVLPVYQGRSIGTALVEHTEALASDMGFKAIITYGDPEYYYRFGFKAAERFGIKTSDGMYAAALLAAELYAGSLDGISGRFCEDGVFDIDDDLATEFDRLFPGKQELKTPSQTRFSELASMRRKA